MKRPLCYHDSMEEIRDVKRGKKDNEMAEEKRRSRRVGRTEKLNRC